MVPLTIICCLIYSLLLIIVWPQVLFNMTHLPPYMHHHRMIGRCPMGKQMTCKDPAAQSGSIEQENASISIDVKWHFDASLCNVVWGWKVGEWWIGGLACAGARQQIMGKLSVRDDYQLNALKALTISKRFLMRICEGGITSPGVKCSIKIHAVS